MRTISYLTIIFTSVIIVGCGGGAGNGSIPPVDNEQLQSVENNWDEMNWDEGAWQ